MLSCGSLKDLKDLVRLLHGDSDVSRVLDSGSVKWWECYMVSVICREYFMGECVMERVLSTESVSGESVIWC